MSRSGLSALAFALLLTVRPSTADFDIAGATNRVGLDLYRQILISAPAKNLALSPYSIESALALAYAGADGQTHQEMARVLNFPDDEKALSASMSSLRKSLDQETENGTEWHVANRLFGQQGYKFRATFLETLKEDYAAPFAPVDFVHQPEETRATINAWVDAQTSDKIRDLIPSHGLSPLVRLVLVNAVYLKAQWACPFETRDTVDLPFYPREGSPEVIPTMRLTAILDYLKGNGFTAFTYPYRGRNLQLLIILPDARDGLASLMATLPAGLLRASAHLGQSKPVTIYLPKFRLASPTVDLAKNLQASGMKTAFNLPTGSANFDRMAPRQPDDYLQLSNVFHQSFIAVDEEGTEASGATAVVGGFGASLHPAKTIEVHVDHPFFFAIQDRRSGVCLFIGSVSDPR